MAISGQVLPGGFFLEACSRIKKLRPPFVAGRYEDGLDLASQIPFRLPMAFDAHSEQD
jgi:hypothetical protein